MPSFSGAVPISLVSGDPYTSEISFDIAASIGFTGDLTRTTESASAYADPYIFVDPSFPGAANYTVTVSPGIDNSAQAPEPGTLSLIALAVSAAGAVRRRVLGATPFG